MSRFSKAAKKVEKVVSRAATNLGVGNDLKKAANIFGAANVGGAVGIVTGFLAGGPAGAIYGGATGATVAGYGKYRGDSSSKYLSNAAGDAAIVASVGSMIYKPGGTALITSPGPVASYGPTTLVQTQSGGLIGTLSSGVGNVFTDAVNYIGKGGLTQIAVDAVRKLFTKDPGGLVNPDAAQGNAIPPGGSFPQWLTNILPGRSNDPTNPNGVQSSSGGGANPTVEVGGSSYGGGGTDLSILANPIKFAGIGLALVAGYFLIKKKGFALG